MIIAILTVLVIKELINKFNPANNACDALGVHSFNMNEKLRWLSNTAHTTVRAR